MTISELQKQITKNNWNAYIVTRNNMFIGQDVLEEENKIKELCGFSGSAGTLLITPETSYLLVDGRYEIQAAQETDPSVIKVICTSDSIGSWIAQNIAQNSVVAYDPLCHSINETDFWHRILKHHIFVEDQNHILGNRLSKKEVDIFEHNIEYSGISVEEKVSYLTSFMLKNNLDAYFLTDCDAVSWLLNLRSNCLKCTPILRAFALIDKNGEISLFTNNIDKIEAEIAKYKDKTIGVSPNSTPKTILTLAKKHKIWLHNHMNPIQKIKAKKNPIELSGFKNAHIRDAVAMCNFLCWLQTNWHNQTELSIVQKLYEYRSQQQLFQSNSFETIAGVNANGAIVHYQPNSDTNQNLNDESLLLLDSGAQYLDGTTDITRTVAIGKISDPNIIDSYTQVLKAHIAAASARFPQSVTGNTIDIISRSVLWKYGKDYKHGTGHGVGHHLNVHEGPFSLSSYKNPNILETGQVTSIEPGYYVEGKYGIRIENLYYIADDLASDLATPMLKFEPLTLVPIDKSLINKYLLNQDEINWINNYHKLVLEKIHPLLSKEVQNWLIEATAPI
ncbi:MAG: M24 family metallopeptidase [Alphaproteobacteria bacterium]|nr:M24 family metallopeptidase [Alphaproteobacteria bacterium]